MRKIICFLLCISVILSSSSVFASAEEAESLRLLSEMSESECVAFVKENGIAIPELYEDESKWGVFIKNAIILFENNPDMVSPYNYGKTSEFFLAIGRAVNEYYGTSRSLSAFALTSIYIPYRIDELACNTQYGSWSNSYENYNCYGFALGNIYNKIDPGVYDYLTRNSDGTLEEYRENFSVVGLDVLNVANLVCDDLVALNCSGVTKLEHEMSTENMCTNEVIICIKISDIDYHLMRYVNGIWLHKPGETQILQYNSTPNSTDAWPHEFIYDGEAWMTDMVYNSDVYFISFNGHDWQYSKNNNGEHTLTCSICEDTMQEDCKLDYTCVNNYYHKGTCADCGYTTSKESCKYTYVGNGSGKHTATCSVCGGSAESECSLSYTYSSSNRHTATCSVCKKSFTKACTIEYTYCGSNTVGDVHSAGCKYCGHITGTGIEDCTFEYVFAGTYNGVNKHRQVCTECDHAETALGLCLYKNGNNCTLCGTSKDTTSTAATGEDTEAE